MRDHASPVVVVVTASACTRSRKPLMMLYQAGSEAAQGGQAPGTVGQTLGRGARGSRPLGTFYPSHNLGDLPGVR